MAASNIAEEFFETYTRALLERDAEEIGRLYAVPALILFPGQSIAVTDPAQTRDFFAGAFAQYEGVTDARPAIVVAAATEHSVWADVTWSYTGSGIAGERNLYQLVRVGDGWKIAVLTPMGA